jgi:HEAT repeat protein
LGLDQGAPVAVTALAIDPEDEQIIYAAVNIWLGTNTAHLTPLGVAVSVDGGRQWLELSRARLGDTPLQRIEPVKGQPLTVVTANSAARHTVSLALSPELLALLQDRDPAVRASAARAIGLIGDSAALPGLLRALADRDALAGQRIAEVIGRIGDRSVSGVLMNMLRSGPAAERTGAALALGLLRSSEAVPGLAALLGTGDPRAQRVAAEALAAIGTPSAIAALMAPLAGPQLTSAQHAAMGGLEMAGQSAVGPLVAALLDGNVVVRANAAEMIGFLQPIDDPGQRADAVAGLSRLLSDPDPTVQAQAAWALGEMDDGQARLALDSAPVLAPISARQDAPAPLAALPRVVADVTADTVAVGTTTALLTLVMVAGLAVVLIWRGKRAASHLGHT